MSGSCFISCDLQVPANEIMLTIPDYLLPHFYKGSFVFLLLSKLGLKVPCFYGLFNLSRFARHIFFVTFSSSMDGVSKMSIRQEKIHDKKYKYNR